MRYFKRSISKDELIKLVDHASDIIRTAVDYKFILVLLFFKRLSDKVNHEMEELRMDLRNKGLSDEQIEKEIRQRDYYRVYIPAEYLWDKVTRDVNSLPTNLATAISEIAKHNSELKGVIDRVDFIEFAKNQENRMLLSRLVELFNKYEFDAGIEEDIFGDAYEHILMRFAPEKAKEGEIYTPRSVVRLLVELVEPEPDMQVYDPCCGSGGMLIYSHLYVRARYGEEKAKRLVLYGQERNPEIYAICKMNLLLHGAENVHVENGDTLLYPKFKEGGRIKRFDIVLANPPWNQDGYNEDTLKSAEFRDRFVYGYPPDSSADWAWIQHMLASIRDDGRVALVIDNGCLFRGGREGAIRSEVLDEDLVESVILLPEKLFYNTGAPGVVILFRKNKNKPPERMRKILFINASNEYVKHPDIKKLNTLSDENIRRIVDAYRNFRDVDGGRFARVVELEKVKENGYNLNVTLYVMPMEEREDVDILKEYEELRKIEEERRMVMERLEQYIIGVRRALNDEHEDAKDEE